METENEKATIKFFENKGPDWLDSRPLPGYTEELLEFIQSYISKHQRILDIACGSGRIALPLIENGYNVSGVDLTAKLVMGANGKIKQLGIEDNKFFVGNMKNLPFDDEEFDIGICLWASFNFLLSEEEELQALNEFYRVLRSGGKCIIEIPHHETSSNIIDYEVDDDSYMYKPITKEDLESVCIQSKFKKNNIFIQEIASRKRLIAILGKSK